MTSTSTQRFSEKRELILDGAAQLFNRRGIKAGTLSEVAASVGLATTSLTYYYRKKEDLATACFLRAIAAHDALAQCALAAVPAQAPAATVAPAGSSISVDGWSLPCVRYVPYAVSVDMKMPAIA